MFRFFCNSYRNSYVYSLKNPDKVMKDKTPLLFCILMDALGYVTYVLPVAGEWGDVIWAPISAYVFISFSVAKQENRRSYKPCRRSAAIH